MQKYGNGGKPGPASKCKVSNPPTWCSGYYLAGMVSASVMADALRKAGQEPHAKGRMKAVLHMNIKNDPFILPGIRVKTSPTDRWPIEQAQLQRWRSRSLASVREARHRSRK